MINANFFIGLPVNFKDIAFVYPPTVFDMVGNTKVPLYRQLLTVSHEDIEDQLWGKDFENDISKITVPTPLEYLFSLVFQSEEYKELAKDAFQFFIHEPVTFLIKEKKIIIGDISEVKRVEDLRILSEENYFEFQNLLRESMGEKAKTPPDPTEHPRVKKMKARARYRDRVKAKKEGITLGTNLAAICCMGIGINPLNIREISFCAVSILTRMYQDKEKYSIDIDSLLAGAKAKDVDLKYWIREDKD